METVDALRSLSPACLRVGWRNRSPEFLVLTKFEICSLFVEHLSREKESTVHTGMS